MQSSAYWRIPDYYDLTPREYSLKVQGVKEYREQQSRNDWEQTRFISWWASSNEVKKQLKSPRDLMRFDWEETKIDELKRQHETRKGLFPNKIDG